MRDASSKAARQGQADTRALRALRFSAVGKGANLIFRGFEPGERSRGFFFVGHLLILAPLAYGVRAFDRRLPVL